MAVQKLMKNIIDFVRKIIKVTFNQRMHFDCSFFCKFKDNYNSVLKWQNFLD